MEHLLVFPQLDVEHFALEVEFAKRPVLYIVPQNQPVRGVTCVLASAYEANDVRSEKHFSHFDATLEIYLGE